MRALLAITALAALGCSELRARDEGPLCVGTDEQPCSRSHDPGIQDEASDAFHGRLLARTGWDLKLCGKCHGDDLSGGRSGASCFGCHERGPTTCDTCHSKIGAQGAHAAHLTSPLLGRPLDCDSCHVKPGGFFDDGHARFADGSQDPPPVEVRFTVEGSPRFDGASKACSVYCHGATLSDQLAEPRWTQSATAASCSSCHGMPPASHARERCGECHGRVADDAGRLVEPALHLDGRVDLGDGSGTCFACHAMKDRAHVDHLAPRRGLSGPIACAACHLEPRSVTDPGHVDSAAPAEVFPSGFGGLAAARGASPSFAEGRCASTYCHGAGSSLAWGGPDASVYCGSCHGVPPADADHPGAMTLQDCARCHASSIGPLGNLLIPSDRPPAHLNGVIDR